MTNQERREKRYIRRQVKRWRARKERFAKYNDPEYVFSYRSLVQAFYKAKRNVSWKTTVSRYWSNFSLHILETRYRLRRRIWRSAGFYSFVLRERGHIRDIKSVGISERVVQRAFCDYCLTPILIRRFVLDNYASQIGKGYHFAIKRLRKHLTHHIHKYGRNGYILIFDFRHFFETIRHDLCESIIFRDVTNRDLQTLYSQLLRDMGEIGLTLGSQVSQISALTAADPIDHFIREVLRLGSSGRYMDDGFVISNSKCKLQNCLQCLRSLCRKYGFVLNPKKTRIIPLRKGFTFLQKRFRITETGKIIMKIARGSITRARRRLKKYKVKLLQGRMTMQDIRAAYQSWESYARRCNSYKTISSMRRLYTQLFNEKVS